MSNPSPSKQEIEKAFADAVQKDNLCPIGKVILQSEHGKIIGDKVADDLHYSAAVIARVLRGLGFPPISPESINRHRKGACRCAPEVTR